MGIPRGARPVIAVVVAVVASLAATGSRADARLAWHVDRSAPVARQCFPADVTHVPATRILWMAGFCTHGAPIVERHTPHQGWRLSRVGLAGDVLGSLAAVAPGNVWMVGSRNDQPLAMHWDGTSWSEVTTARLPPGTVGGQLSDVVAISADDLWTVGTRYAKDARAGWPARERTLISIGTARPGAWCPLQTGERGPIGWSGWSRCPATRTGFGRLDRATPVIPDRCCCACETADGRSSAHARK